MTLPIVIDRLKEHLGNAYKDEDWKPAFDAVFNAEGDVLQAQEAIHNLATANQLPKLIIKIPARPRIAKLDNAEAALMTAIETMKERHIIRGSAPTIEDLVNPPEEQDPENEDELDFRSDADIVAAVHHEMAIERGEIEQEDGLDDEKEPEHAALSRCEIIQLCETLEKVSLLEVDATFSSESLNLTSQLRKYRAHLQRVDNESLQQSTIDKFFA